MLIWLLALLLLSISIYAVYRLSFSRDTKETDSHSNHYTFKI
jgi:hypothetical protein